MTELPAFEFDEEAIANIRANLGIPDVEETDEKPFIPEPPRRRAKINRRKSRDDYEEPEPTRPEVIPPAPLTKRDEREVDKRLQNILLGATGMLGIAKPYLEMTEEEAKAISEPLSSYLVRNADTIPIAHQVLENYDLLAITLGVMAYVVRVYRDRSEEVAEQVASKRTLVDRVGSATETPENRSEVRTGGVVTPFDGPSIGYASQV
jgi:hypothetical protein